MPSKSLLFLALLLNHVFAVPTSVTSSLEAYTPATSVPSVSSETNAANTPLPVNPPMADVTAPNIGATPAVNSTSPNNGTAPYVPPNENGTQYTNGTVPTVSDNCLIEAATDNFDSLDKWSQANELDGGGNWEFQWYSDSTNNTYIKDGKLYIVPTLTTEKLGEEAVTGNTPDGKFVLTIPADKCTGRAMFFGCERTAAKGANIINPIMSGKLMSKFTIKPGSRVEVKAKLPQGDWIWPAIWFLPKNRVYGEWPLSGEIDLMESRGNLNVPNGANSVGSTLHWGLSFEENRYPKTHATINKTSGTYADDFHLYTLDWTTKGITMYTDGQVVFNIDFTKIGGFWKFGEFTNGTNPWGDSLAAPFDQEFYMILNVAVGGTANYFPDDMAGKPWKNKDSDAMVKFWNAKDKWLPTWPTGENLQNRAMVVDYVKTTALDENGAPKCN
ncbi:concanavalin A-like lectin/glucanase domain-containing protein [Paraphysoderma sedebokerense]|nr:concanavalin A-like lectin/glucanase domain-containing protein [Paraphysoderma sedebokerense]